MQFLVEEVGFSTRPAVLVICKQNVGSSQGVGANPTYRTYPNEFGGMVQWAINQNACFRQVACQDGLGA